MKEYLKDDCVIYIGRGAQTGKKVKEIAHKSGNPAGGQVFKAVFFLYSKRLNNQRPSLLIPYTYSVASLVGLHGALFDLAVALAPWIRNVGHDKAAS